GFGGSLHPLPEFRSGQTDGVDPNSPRTLPRTNVLNAIMNKWTKHRRILIRLPPSSGKTSLCQLLEKHLVETQPTARTVMISGLEVQGDFVKFWREWFGVPWNEWISQKIKTYLLIDHAHYFFGPSLETARMNSAELWAAVESTHHDLKVIMFASYGYRNAEPGFGPPISFDDDQCMGLLDLRLDIKECVDLVRRIEGLNSILPSAEIPELARFLFANTSGHVGLVRDAVTEVVWRFRNEVKVDWWVVRKFLGSHAFMGSIQEFRGMPTIRKSASEPEDIRLLDQMLDDDNHAYPHDAHPDSVTAGPLLRTGFALQTPAQSIVFAAPWIATTYRVYRCADLVKATVMPYSLRQFLITILRSISPANLRLSLRRGMDHRLKEAYRGEFFRAAWQAIPDFRGTVSLEVGGLDGRTNEANLAVECDGKYWIVDLLRDGDTAAEHLQRMTESDAYGKLLAHGGEYAIIDLREDNYSPSVRTMQPGMTYVEFSANYEKARITFPDRETYEVRVGKACLQIFRGG
ncbi:hypothetical protein HK104_000121, partial [Borealophlyctis nickersoniae]